MLAGAGAIWRPLAPRLVFVLQGKARAPDLASGRACLQCLNAGNAARFFRTHFRNQENAMLKYAIIFAIISLIAGALGFTGVAAGSAGIAKILFGLFLLVAIVFVVLAALGVGAVKKAID